MQETTDVIFKLSKNAAALELEALPDGALQDREEEMPDGLRLDPVVILTASVTVAWIIERIVDHYIKSREEVVVIDLSKPTMVIERIRGAERIIMVKKPDVQIEVIPVKERTRPSLVGTLKDILSS